MTLTNFFIGIGISLLLAAVAVALYYYVFRQEETYSGSNGQQYDKKKATGKVDQELSEAPEDFNIDKIPEEDQEYLIPILSNLLQEYIPIKVRYASNAMLIEHLGKALGEAANSFEKRKNASEDEQIENEDWLKVAAWALRLYKEGTVHNSDATRERFTMVANLAGRELKAYATATMNQAGGKIQKAMDGEDPEEQPKNKDMKAVDLGQNKMQPYTDSEIQDMKDAADRDMGNDEDDDRIIEP
jgi:hypothetical protein